MNLDRRRGESGDRGRKSHRPRATGVSAWVLLALGVAGCSVITGPKADQTAFYALSAPAPASAPNAAAASAANAPKLLIRRVEIPGYLQPKAFAVRGEGGAIAYVDSRWWSEPLDLAIGRVVRERVGAATGRTVAARRDGEYDMEAIIRVVQCEGSVEGGKPSAKFAASVEIVDPASGRRLAERRTSSEEPWDGKDYGALAASLGRQAAKLGDLIVSISPRR